MFSCEIAKFFRTSILKNICKRLLLTLARNELTKTYTVNRSQNTGRLSDKTVLYYRLAGSVDVEMSEKSRLKITYFCKMIVLFSSIKQLPTSVIVKLWRLICCVDSYNCSKVQLFFIVKTKLLSHKMYVILLAIYPKFKHFCWPGWNIQRYKNV